MEIVFAANGPGLAADRLPFCKAYHSTSANVLVCCLRLFRLVESLINIPSQKYGQGQVRLQPRIGPFNPHGQSGGIREFAKV
jgi:hypothetical protein